MKTILVPTDFSKSSDAALSFAIILARRNRAKILLTHVIQPVMPSAPIAYVPDPADWQSLREEIGNRLKSLSGRITYAGGISFEYFVSEGGPVATICQLAGEKKADLIVMGMSQKGPFERFVFGSTALGVIGDARQPVLVVPEGTHMSETIGKITFATNYLVTDHSDLRMIADLARPDNAELCIMHISTEENSPEADVKKFNDFVQEASDRVGYNRISAEFLTGPSASLRMRQYIEDRKTGLLVVSARDRGFFARLFGKSFTRATIEAATIPVIAFHHPNSEVAALNSWNQKAEPEQR